VRPDRRGALLVAAAAILWSTGGFAIKFAPVSAFAVVFHRAWIAAIKLLLLLRPRRFRPTPAFAVACVSYAAMIVTFVVATKWTTAANAIFLQDSGIVWVLLFSPLIAREPILRRDAAAVALALAGMTLFFVGKISAHGQAGNLIALASGVFYAVTILMLRRQRGPASEWTAIFGNTLAALFVFPFLSHAFVMPPSAWAALVFLGVVQIGCAYALFVRGLMRVSATEASIVALIEPILNPVWVFLLLGERPAPLALVGAAIVIAAILWRTLASGSAPTGAIPSPD
jgi:drug/metabolite transporter (DMT)-like permease